MKNDSIPPGIRPTTKSTAISGRKTPRPKARIRNVTSRPAPPASTPAANRYQGSRPKNDQRRFHPSATRGLLRGARLNLCPKPQSATNPLFRPRRVGGLHGWAAEHAGPSGPADCPHGVLDDAPDRRRDDRSPRARPRNSGFDRTGLRCRGGRGVRAVGRGGPYHARSLGDFREQPQPQARVRLDRAGGPGPQGNDSAREHPLRAEVSFFVSPQSANHQVDRFRPAPIRAADRREYLFRCNVVREGIHMRAERLKLRAAEWLYRWNLSMSVLGIVFTILTFVGVFALVLRQYFANIGLNELVVLLVLLAITMTIIIGFGLFLDKFLRFWSAQTTVATVRNQFLTSALYQKELLIMKYSQVPQMEGLLRLVEELPDSPGKMRLVEQFRESLQKLQKTIETKEWEVAPDERTY